MDIRNCIFASYDAFVQNEIKIDMKEVNLPTIVAHTIGSVGVSVAAITRAEMNES